MFFVAVGTLGIASGYSFRWFVLPVFSSILAMALGIEAALHGRTFGSAVFSTILMLTVLDVSYVAGALSRNVPVKGWLHRRT